MKTRTEPIQVACVADDRFAPYCATMLHSLLVHCTGRRVAIHYLCPPELPATTKNKLRKLISDTEHSLTFHTIPDADVEGLPAMRGIERIVWYRVMLPELLPDTRRILYLDADTLVADSVVPLWEIPLDGTTLAAVPNVIEPVARHRQLQALGLPDAATYFNSGVMLMNLSAMREQECTSRTLAYAREAGTRLIWGDQDALNAILATCYHQLHPRWNCQNSLFSWPPARRMFGDEVVDDAIRNPAILHFGGSDLGRPWNYICEHPYKDLYRSHLKKTPWGHLPLQGQTWKNMLKKHTPQSVLCAGRRVAKLIRERP